MASMTRVMEKLQEGTAAEPPPVEAASSPVGKTDGGPSAFVPGEVPPERVPPVPIATWQPARIDSVLVAFHDRYSAVCEQFRAVRARLLTMNAGNTPQVLAITSAIPEEGKSSATLNLALVMAEGGEHQILVADADFRRTSMARMLGLPGEPGLAEVLRGETTLAAALQPTPFPNLQVLPAGKVRDNAYAEVLGGSAMETLLADLRRGFDYAFLDTPPITTVSDVCLLAPRCDGAIVVVQMRRTPEPTVQQAVRTLQANNVRILGCILSRFRERTSGYYDRYYSSYYAR